MATERRAEVTWQGSLMEGAGTIDRVTSGVLGPLDVTWASRAEDPDGRTSPEELIAAAHAACFSMALSHALAQAGNPPDQLDVEAAVDFVAGKGITGIKLSVNGKVPGITADEFAEFAEGAKKNCPVSQALAAVPITLDVTFTA